MLQYQELSRSVKGRKVIVTGAASGMGRATAHLFAREGAYVAVTDLNLAACEAVVDEIKAAGFDTAKAWAMDMADNQMIAQVTGEIAAAFGGLDIIVNNAGFAMQAMIDGDDYAESWDKSLAVMLEGPQMLIRESLKHLRQSDAARIINMLVHKRADTQLARVDSAVQHMHIAQAFLRIGNGDLQAAIIG